MRPFDHNKFIGYICEVTPQYVRLQIPSAKLLRTFYFNGEIFQGGSVGSFVVIEGQEYGFLGRVFELNLPQGERIEITDKSVNEVETQFHPIAKIELLALFDIYNPKSIIKTVARYPSVGAKVFSCSDEQIGAYISAFGIKKADEDIPFAPIGKLTSNNALCNISLNSLFGRHCAILGTTGGGKSWTVAKLVELVSKYTKNKCILIDATGEYNNINNRQDIELGTGEYIFDYTNLSIDELYYLLHPSSKTQVPKLMEAIRSLKMSKLDNNAELSVYYKQDTQGKPIKGNLFKAKKEKRPFDVFRYKYTSLIEDKFCNFDFELLAAQITNECNWDSDRNNTSIWGDRNEIDVSNCISLISRINNIMSTSEYNNIFGFRKNFIPNAKDLKNSIQEFILRGKTSILRLDFSKVSFDYQVREILVNAIGNFLLDEARKGIYKDSPIIIFIDEAHQFLNKTIADEYFSAKPLDAFEQISKEARKYGLFLSIATQMPRDIPLGTLSQIGTFIVHRLINEQDKKAVENAASAANRNSLAFLPILGEGEALIVGVDFPMPLTIKIDAPENKPDSNTPKLQKQ